MEDLGNVHKKSSEILFAEYGMNYEDGEIFLKDPTQENRRVIDLYDPVDAMSLNRDKDRLVVAGMRGVLQLVKVQTSSTDLIEGPSIIKDVDMRAYRKGKASILYSAQNVKWNQIYEQYIATTSSSGSIICWNVNRKNKSVYKAHERSATCLDWHSTAPYILVSGSRDCAVKSYDLRAKDIHQLTFRLSESVRDVATIKHSGYEDYFFCVDDGGVLRLWDLRQTKRSVIQKVAHRSFVSTLSLNPDDPTLLATGGGRDKLVKVWQWSGPELNRTAVIETTAPLARVAWRPGSSNQLATCSSVNETTVHVWDIRRPYLPCVTYDEHCDSVTDACWPSKNFDSFISCGKDGLVVLHNIDHGHAPITYACDGAFDITPDGIMAVAVNSEVHARNDAEMEAIAIPANSSKKTLKKFPYETFNKSVKSLIGFGVPESLTHSLPPNTFYRIAEKYHIGGMDIVTLCEINSKVSRKSGMEHVAQTWKLVEALCAQAKIQEEYSKMSAEEKLRIIKAWIVRKKELAEEGRRWLSNLDDIKRSDVKKIVRERLENTQHVTAFLNFSSGSDSENNSDKDIDVQGHAEEEPKKGDLGENDDEAVKKKKKKKKKVTFTDFYFGGGESNFNEVGGKKETLHLNEFMGLRSEAFDIRDERAEAKFFCKARKQPTTSEEYERDLKIAEAEFQAWSPMLEIYRLLQYHAEQGDMQTCATVSMVCGKRLFDAVDPYTINGWIMCYMEMLDKLELFLVCARIRKYCPLESINSVSRENTTIQLAHSKCDAIIVSGRCSKCEKAAQSDCTVCRGPIIGLTYQCYICGHAMHCDHAYEWFQKTVDCAYVGCPCTCGQTTWPDVERTFIPNDDLPREHRKFVREPETGGKMPRVEASRIDTDSDEFQDNNEEFSPGAREVCEKLGIRNPKEDKPWARYLAKLYSRRKRKRAIDQKRKEEENRDSEDEEEAKRAKKDLEKEKLRAVLAASFQEKRNENMDLGSELAVPEDSESNYQVDRDDYVEDYLASSEEEDEEEEDEEQQMRHDQMIEQRGYGHLKRPLEGIAEEPEESEDEDSFDEGAPKYQSPEDQEPLEYDAESIELRMHENGAYQYQHYVLNIIPDETDEEEEEDEEVYQGMLDRFNASMNESDEEDSCEDENEEEEEEKVEYEYHKNYDDDAGDEQEDESEYEIEIEGEEEEDIENANDEDQAKGEIGSNSDGELQETLLNIIGEHQNDEEPGDDSDLDEEVCEDEEGVEGDEEYESELGVQNGHAGLSPVPNTNGNLEENFKTVRRLTFAESSESESNGDGEPSQIMKKSEMSVKDRVLAVLNMSKREMQKDRAFRKKRQRADGSEVSDDEYAVTSDDNISSDGHSSLRSLVSRKSSSCANSASSGRDDLESTSDEDLKEECSFLNSSGGLYEQPVSSVVHKTIDMREARRSMSMESVDGKLENDEVVFVGVSGACLSSSSSDRSSAAASPTPSFPSCRTKVADPSSPSALLTSSQHDLKATKESSQSPEEADEAEAADIVPAIELLPKTSCANPIFPRVAVRPPLSNPVEIQVNGVPNDRRDGSHTSLSSLFRNMDNACSAPADLGIANPLFGQTSTASLPAQNYIPTRRMRYNTIHNDPDFVPGSHKNSLQSNGFLSSEVLANFFGSRHSLGSRHSSTQSLAGSIGQKTVADDVPTSVAPILHVAAPESVNGHDVPTSKTFIGMDNSSVLQASGYFNVFEADFLQQTLLAAQRKLEEGEESDDSVLFSDDDRGKHSPSQSDENDDEEPFFPQIDDVPVSINKAHPWETEEQFQQRLLQEEEEEAAERLEQEEEEEDEEEPMYDIYGRRITPMQKTLDRLRKQRDRYASKPETVEKFQSDTKRVWFGKKMHEDAMEVALENLKEDKGEFEDVESEGEDVEQEVCIRCKDQVKFDKQEKEYVQWIRKSADDGQIILTNSLSEPCTKYQLAYLEEYLTDAEEAKRTKATFVEFVKLFYFIQWDKLMRPGSEFMLKEIFELWDDFRKKRHRVCREHYKDFSFRFFTSSIAVKIKQTLFSMETLQARREAIPLNWAHLKPCVVTLNDDISDIERVLEKEAHISASWTENERAAAREYWNLFGTIPLHISSTEKDAYAPNTVEKLEIIDDTNYWTRKMLKSVIYNRRNRNIKLSYTKRKKTEDIFRVQQKAEEELSNRWKTRLNHMINETPHFDFESSTLKVRTKEGLIYTEDAYNPWPVCQIDDGDHFVTIRPLVTKKLVEIKSRIRSKFHVNRRAIPKSSRSFNVTKEDIRKTQSFKRFEPKLKKKEELTAMFSKHFKVIERREIRTNYELYTIVEEDEEVSLIVKLLEKQKMMGDLEVLDPEDVFADRREMREEKEIATLARMNEEKYRKTLANTERFDNAKMSFLKKSWIPQFKKTFEKAQRAIQLGKILVDEDIQKWMEYQYELSFVKKSIRRKSLITKAVLKQNVPPKWHDAIEQMDFSEPSFPPPYAPIPKGPLSEASTPSLPSFNSSSEDENEDELQRPLKTVPVEYEKCVDLVDVSAKLQDEFEIRIKLEDKDDDWQYSDDSSVTTWFDGDCDDILNRLVNLDYLDEHMVLKERSKGALGRKLWEVMEEKREQLESDEEDDESLQEIILKDRIEDERDDAEYLSECEAHGDFGNIGSVGGEMTKRMTEAEMNMDLKRNDKKEIRELEMEQLRYFFHQYKLDHSYTTEPFSWSDEFKEPIALLHQNELRRVGNRVHKKMKEEYEEKEAMDEMITKQVPADENSLHNKMFNFLMFGQSGESFEDMAKQVDEANQILKPLRKYEMFFGQEGVAKLRMISEEVMECMTLRSSIKYICSQFGENMNIPEKKLIGFLKLWWYSSPQSIEGFVRTCEEAYVTEEKIIDELIEWDELPQNINLVRDTIEELEIGLMLNDIVYVVELYVEETEALFRAATNPEDQIAFSTMDVWDWHEVKYGHPYLYPDLGEARQKLLDSESEMSSFDEETPSEGIPEDAEETEESESAENVENGEADTNGQTDQTESHDSALSSDEITPPNQESNLLHSEVVVTVDPVLLRQQMIEHYKCVYEQLRLVEEERKVKNAEENAVRLIEEWDGYEEDQAGEANDIGRKIHEFLTMEMAVRQNSSYSLRVDDAEEAPKVFETWDQEFENIKKGEVDEPELALYAKGDISRYEMLEMCGLPISLDHEMFIAEMDLCQSADTSIADAEDLADVIEKGFEDDECEVLTGDIDNDARSYCSVKHVLKHELYFQREVQSRHLPACVVIFTPKQFFEDPVDFDLNYKKWRRIIEASDSPYSFNRLVMRERLLKKCRDEFCFQLVDKYFEEEDRDYQKILEVFHRCLVVIVVDTELNPWTCRIVSRDDMSTPAHNRKTFIRKNMIEDSQRELIFWLRTNKIDMDVYSRCPVIVDREGPLSLADSDIMTNILIEDDVQEEWLSIWKDEGVRALDAVIRMPPPSKDKLIPYKAIFKPIYDAWYLTWKYENDRLKTKTILKRKPDRVKEYMHKAKIIVNYAHQHYRMKRFDNLLSKDPTGFHTMDRSDVPSASLFDNLDSAVTKFCEQDSPHLKESDKLIVRDALIQLATGKIPHFTINYFGGTDFSEEQEVHSQSEDENDDDQPPPQPFTDVGVTGGPVAVPKDSKHPDQDDFDEEYDWLRSMYEDNDMDRRRFMARILFEIAQKAMYRFAPHLANFEGAQRKFQHLLKLHATQRPLLDMMLTKVRGTYFMPLETNMFLYQHKLITFGELVESEVHPRDMRDEKFTLEKLRRQEPRDAQQMADFLDGLDIDTDSDESGSDTSSDPSSSDPSSMSGSTESLDSDSLSKKKKKMRKRAKKTVAKAQRDEMIVKLRSKPDDPDEAFSLEKRALGPKLWKTRRKINDMLEGIADLDKTKIKLPVDKRRLLDHVNKLIVENSDTAHWSWGDLKMKSRINCIPPIHRMKQKHIDKIKKGMKTFHPARKYDTTSKKEDGRKWF